MTKKVNQQLALVTYKQPVTQNKKPKQMGQKQRRNYQNPRMPPAIAKLLAFPFEQNNFGAKCPDESMLPTATMVARDLNTFGGPSAAGSLWATVYTTTISNQTINCLSGQNNGITWQNTDGSAPNTGSFSVKYSAALSTFNMIRPVAGGIRIKNINSVGNTTGVIHYAVMSVNESVGIRNNLPLTIADLANQPTYGTVAASQLLDNEFVIRHLPYDNKANEFRELANFETSTNFARQTSGWGYIVVLYEGFAAGQPGVEVEHIVHYEATLLNKNAGVVSTTDAAPYSPTLLAATTNLMAMLNSGYAEGPSSNWSQKYNAMFSQAYDMAIGAIPYIKTGAMILGAL